MPEPGELALGIAARIPLPLGDGFGEGDLAAQICQETGYAMSAHGREHGIEAPPT
jgi:hypothetical protein